MDQIKIGKFIADLRKKQGLTQEKLAEKLNITDKAVSKWETGKAMPDSSIMLKLCAILGITVNDLLSGEKIGMENYNKEMENNLIEMVKLKEQADKRMLTMEIVMGVLALIPFIIGVAIMGVMAVTNPEAEWKLILPIVFGVLPLLVATPFAIKIEQTAGYYECQNCGHRYVPTYKSVLMAMHVNRTRYMRCPECGKKTWQKKVISKQK